MPDTYELQLLIRNDDLVHIVQAGQSIMIAKHRDGQASPLVWGKISPLSTNEIRWQESYGLYASTDTLKPGASISPTYQIAPAIQSGGQYAILPGGDFTGFQPVPGQSPDSFAIRNQIPFPLRPSIVCGLTQELWVGGQKPAIAPISAETLLSMQTATMTPSNTVDIWLQSGTPLQMSPGSAPEMVRGQTLTVVYPDNVFSQIAVFDPIQGGFTLR